MTPPTTQTPPAADAGGAGSAPARTPGPVERICGVICLAALATMLVVVGVDIATRTFLNFSFQIAEEVASYMLVILTFFGLAVTQGADGFHRVEFLPERLSPRGRAILRLVFDLATLVLAGLLLWIFWRFVQSSWRFGTVAPTTLATPRWIAQSPMVLGLACFCIAIIRSALHHARLIRAAQPNDGTA